MKFAASSIASSLTCLALSFTAPVAAHAGIDEKIPDAQMISALQSRALQSGPREQCFLYAELVHDMTEMAGRQLLAGDMQQVSLTLESVRQYAEKIHMGVANDSKRLKNAEILVRHTAFRLKDILSAASSEDRPTLTATLKQLDQVEAEMMLQVFQK